MNYCVGIKLNSRNVKKLLKYEILQLKLLLINFVMKHNYEINVDI